MLAAREHMIPNSRDPGRITWFDIRCEFNVNSSLLNTSLGLFTHVALFLLYNFVPNSETIVKATIAYLRDTVQNRLELMNYQ